jgi:hypothetical protein
MSVKEKDTSTVAMMQIELAEKLPMNPETCALTASMATCAFLAVEYWRHRPGGIAGWHGDALMPRKLAPLPPLPLAIDLCGRVGAPVRQALI